MLLAGTGWFIFIALWNASLLIRYDEVMNMPKWTRLVPFGASLIFLCYYLAGAVTEIVKLFNGETW